MTENIEGKIGILVVDDEAATRTLYRLMIESGLPQATIYLAEEGGDALEQLPNIVRENGQVVIISDIEMPGMTGPKFVRAVRSSGDEQLAQIPVLFTSGRGDTDANQMITDQLQGEGINTQYEFLRKPVRITQIVETVNKLLQGDVPKN
jgi:CheY-like chemotaxis protein